MRVRSIGGSSHWWGGVSLGNCGCFLFYLSVMRPQGSPDTYSHCSDALPKQMGTNDHKLTPAPTMNLHKSFFLEGVPAHGCLVTGMRQAPDTKAYLICHLSKDTACTSSTLGTNSLPGTTAQALQLE